MTEKEKNLIEKMNDNIIAKQYYSSLLNGLYGNQHGDNVKGKRGVIRVPVRNMVKDSITDLFNDYARNYELKDKNGKPLTGAAKASALKKMLCVNGNNNVPSVKYCYTTQENTLRYDNILKELSVCLKQCSESINCFLEKLNNIINN